MFLSPKQVLHCGLDFLELNDKQWSKKTKIIEIHKHLGSSALDLADIWYDVVEEADVTEEE